MYPLLSRAIHTTALLMSLLVLPAEAAMTTAGYPATGPRQSVSAATSKPITAKAGICHPSTVEAELWWLRWRHVQHYQTPAAIQRAAVLCYFSP